jgi:hypothetical protein
MNDDRDTLDQFLTANPHDPGCDAGADILDQYVELELAGQDPATRYPGTAIHLRSCADCRRDHDGLLELASSFGTVEPPA